MAKRVNRVSLSLAAWLLVGLLLSVFLGSGVANAEDQAPLPEQVQALERINYYRQLVGVPPAKLHPALMQSAMGHANYVKKNGWGGDPHVQEEGKDGFTAKTMSDRGKKAGYTGSINENMGAIGDPVRAVDELMNTVSHRTPILEPAYTDIGYGWATGKNAVDVIAFGSTSRNFNFNPPIIQFPPSGYTGFGTTFWGEMPSPFPGEKFPLGNPVTLTYRGTGKFELVPEESSLYDQDGSRVESVLGEGKTFTMRNTLILAAKKPLTRNRTYTVKMTFKIDGKAQSRTWDFSTGPRLASGMTYNLLQAPTPVRDLWREIDGAVAQGTANGRTWLLGPDVYRAETESYAGAPDGKRQVWYFDKARLELLQKDGKTTVTSGLLAKELVTGQIQLGDNKFEARSGNDKIYIAGDDEKNAGAPTYATFGKLLAPAKDRTGQVIGEFVDANGKVTSGKPPAELKYANFDKTTSHNVPAVFMDVFGKLPRDWVWLVGLPISEAYWTKAKVGGKDRDILVQVFERRVVTYTPSNSAAWRVEMGNVSYHYAQWRYKTQRLSLFDPER